MTAKRWARAKNLMREMRWDLVRLKAKEKPRGKHLLIQRVRRRAMERRRAMHLLKHLARRLEKYLVMHWETDWRMVRLMVRLKGLPKG